MSPFFAVIMVALIMSAGLVIDGGQKIAATSRAETAAAGASRAAGNAAATQQLGDADPGRSGRTRRAHLPGRSARRTRFGQRQPRHRHRHNSATEPTIFLSMIGIAAVTGTGAAEANIVPTGQTR